MSPIHADVVIGGQVTQLLLHGGHKEGSKASYGLFMAFIYLFSIVLLASPVTPTSTPVVIPEIHQNIKTLELIRACESGGNDLARNPHSSAKGRYQFIDATWAYYGKKLWGENWVNKDVLNGDDQQELAEFVAVKYGLGDWDASYGCWGY